MRIARWLVWAYALLLPAVLAPAAQATFPGTNGLIAYSQGDLFPGSEDLSPHSQVFTLDPTSDAVRRLTDVPKDDAAAAPDWSSDGARIVYERRRKGRFEIWVMNADGTGQKRLTGKDGFDDFLPSFSRDGSRILYSHCSDPFNIDFFADCDIDAINSDGTGRETILDAGAWLDIRAVYSPDSKRIAFSSDRGGLQSAIWMMNADGSKPRRLTKPRLRAFFPDWRPDGRRIIFTDNCCVRGSNVWTMRPDGKGLMQVTQKHVPSDAAFASYSPDARQIVFLFNGGCLEKPCRKFYTAPADGSPLAPHATGKVDPFLTDWGPG
jgi:TolB protein